MQLLPVAAADAVAAAAASAAVDFVGALTTLLTSGLWSMQSVLRTVTGTKLLCCALIDFFINPGFFLKQSKSNHQFNMFKTL